MTGTGESSVLEGVPKQKNDWWDVAVLRLKEGSTSPDKVKSYLQSKNIEVKEVFVFPSKIKGTVSAKVRVALEHKDRALDPAIWPQHLRISSWIKQSKSTRKNDAGNRPPAPESEVTFFAFFAFLPSILFRVDKQSIHRRLP